MTLLSFHNDQGIKDKYIARTDKHLELEELIQGDGFDGTKGCAVGCTLNKYDHEAYETELGLPSWLARIQDTLHEGQTLDDAKIFFKNFLRAIPVGKDLTKVKHQFLIFILDQNIEILKDSTYKSVDEVRAAINQSKALHEHFLSTGEWNESAAESARSAAESAESAARSAARSAAWSAASSAARSAARSAAWAARSAAWSAAESARSAAESAESAAWSARSARSAAESARSAAESAESAAYKKYADKLIALLKEA